MSTKKILWPGECKSFAVLFYVSNEARGLLVCPADAGEYVVVFENNVSKHKITFQTSIEYPCANFDVPIPFNWRYKIVQRKKKICVLEGYIEAGNNTSAEQNFVLWSCNQPFEKKGTKQSKKAQGVYEWYLTALEKINPDIIFAIGDTIYCDAKNGINFVKKVRKEQWQNTDKIYALYVEAYRRHWSLPEFSQALAKFPHIITYDDHEIYDGCGSEKRVDEANIKLFNAATRAADIFVFQNGPLCRRDSHTDNHQIYREKRVATFIFDTRTSRRYKERLFSDQQFWDFKKFLDTTTNDCEIRALFLITPVPVVCLREGWLREISEFPDFAQSLTGVRDDVRDQWASEGSKEQLKQILSVLKNFQENRPDVHIVFLSGDIHVANAFSFKPSGFSTQLYQVTSSALTNPQHAPKIIRELIHIPGGPFYNGNLFGIVERLWPDVDEQNFLHIKVAPSGIQFLLYVFESDEKYELMLNF
jgi:hypothetical protein